MLPHTRQNVQTVISLIGAPAMEDKTRAINLEFTLRMGRAHPIEFWQDNGNGTCTRLSDGMTLDAEQVGTLPGRNPLSLRRRDSRWQ
jgi:hypothetical protein